LIVIAMVIIIVLGFMFISNMTGNVITGSVATEDNTDKDSNHSSLEYEAMALERLKDIPGLQKIVNYNSDDIILTTEYIQGYTLNQHCNQFRTGELEFNYSHVKDLWGKLLKTEAMGVLSQNIESTIFGPKEGFTPTLNRISDVTHSLADVIKWLSLKQIQIIDDDHAMHYLGSGKDAEKNYEIVKEMNFRALREIDPEIAKNRIATFERYISSREHYKRATEEMDK